MGESLAIRPEESLSLQKVGAGLFKSGLFPNAKNEFGAFAIVEYGAELGIPPMMALKNINIISGQVACNAQLMLSLAMSRGVTYEVTKEDADGAIIVFKRQGFEPYTASFLKADADAAGLTGKDNWKKYPKDMYFWRAVAKGVRRIAPDAVMGLYTADEISEGKIINVTDIPMDITPEPEQSVEASVDNEDPVPVVFVPEEIKKVTFPKKDKTEGTKYVIKNVNGEAFETFSKTFAELAVKAKREVQRVEITYKTDKYGSKIEGFRVVEDGE